MPNRTKDQKRAEYYLYSWQIRAIQRMAREQSTTPSDVIRKLLTEVIGGAEKVAAPSQEMIPHAIVDVSTQNELPGI